MVKHPVKHLPLCATWLGFTIIMLLELELCLLCSQVKTHDSKSFKYNGITPWNDFPVNIRETNNMEDFKFKCKKHLFNQMKSEAKSVFTG